MNNNSNNSSATEPTHVPYSKVHSCEGHLYLIEEIGEHFIITSEGDIIADGCDSLEEAFHCLGL